MIIQRQSIKTRPGSAEPGRDFFVLRPLAGAAYAALLAGMLLTAALCLAAGAAGISLVGGLSPFSLIPAVPYWCGSVLAMALIALSAASGALCLSLGYALQGILHPQGGTAEVERSVRAGRLIKAAARSLAVFAVCFTAGFAVCAYTAGTPGFWHAWSWFVR